MDTREDKQSEPASPGASRLDDGGPAFPGAPTLADPAEGMSLRDYFAAKALQGLLSNCWLETDGVGVPGFAKDAYNFADAMLQARRTA